MATMTNEEKKDLVHEMAREVARRLGGEWSADNPDFRGAHWAMATCTDGRALNFSITNGRLHVSACGWPEWRRVFVRIGAAKVARAHPHDLYPRESAPKATIAVDRGLDVICKEIGRRVMVDYARVWVLCEARAKEAQAAEDAKEAAWARICKTAGVPTSKCSVDLVGDIDIRPSSGASVYADRGGSIDTDDAIAIIELMKARKASKKEAV